MAELPPSTSRLEDEGGRFSRLVLAATVALFAAFVGYAAVMAVRACPTPAWPPWADCNPTAEEC